jgi:hypothetical protein
MVFYVGLPRAPFREGLMRRSLPLYLLLLLLGAPCADAAFYQWIDANGVVHFTDKRNNIPPKYRKKARKVQLSEEPSASAVKAAPQTAAPSQPPAAPAPKEPRAKGPLPGGHDEKWWRDQSSTLQDQLQTVQKKIAEKRTKLVELRRKRTLYHRAQDRVAINAMEADLATDEAQQNELQNRIEVLRNDAAKAEVPPDWLR